MGWKKQSHRIILTAAWVVCSATAWAVPAEGSTEETQTEETQTYDVPVQSSTASPATQEDEPTVHEESSGATSMTPTEPYDTYTKDSMAVTQQTEKKDEHRFTDRLRFQVGGGVEGYTGILNNRVNAGPTWGLTVGTQPVRGIGAEIAYSGAVNEASGRISPGAGHLTPGADIVRNGGQAALTLNAPTPDVQPYVTAGIGFDNYNVRGGNSALFRDDTSGRVPLGGGIRGRAGAFTADLRVQYDVLFDQQFAQLTPGESNGGAYTGMLQVGARF